LALETVDWWFVPPVGQGDGGWGVPLLIAGVRFFS